ncbi:hypothetical protein AB0L44_44010 [Nonomuraea wenchangensis]|uniref:hypothetical protein n=1 Tax=Nonomuraea wenchangensis TaxID=568860 RepID=UPI00343E096A
MNALAVGRAGIWAGETDRYPARALRRAAAAVEDLGCPALWLPETTGREAMAQAALLLSATRRAGLLGPRALLAVTQLVVLDPSRARAAELARAHAAAALPNRLALLRGLGFDDADALPDRLVDALVATGGPEDVVRRVEEQHEAGADHVSLHVLTATPDEPPLRQWRELAAYLW